jgi:hypothetical protein
MARSPINTNERNAGQGLPEVDLANDQRRLMFGDYGDPGDSLWT